MARDHLHDASDGVGAIQRALRAWHELDPLDVADVQQREVHAAAECVHTYAIHEHEREIRLTASGKHRRECAASTAATDGQSGYGAHRVTKAFDLPLAERCRR